MEQAYVQRIEQLIRDCPEGSKCHNREVRNLCKARDLGMELFVECLEENPFECVCSVSFGDSWYCSCPPRVHIAKEFER
jgi:hypothetical protein